MKKSIRKQLKAKASSAEMAEAASRLKAKISSSELGEAASQLKEDWDMVFRPQGKAPYFAREGGMRPEFDLETSEFTPGNAWLLAEISRLVYLAGEGEKGRSVESRELRRASLGESVFRERVSFFRRSNHVTIFDSEKGGGFSVVCFRGTMSAKQWLLDLTTIPVSWSEGCYVHQGFKTLFEELWPELLPELETIEGPLFFTGHSLGGALANLAATRFAPDALYTFGAPRVGNSGFRDLLEGVPAYRVVNGSDIVPSLPHAVETFAPYDFQHAGELHYLSGTHEMLVDPAAEEIPVEEAEGTGKPLNFLMESFKSSSPPARLVDHAPSEYARRLAGFLE